MWQSIRYPLSTQDSSVELCLFPRRAPYGSIPWSCQQSHMLNLLKLRSCMIRPSNIAGNLAHPTPPTLQITSTRTCKSIFDVIGQTIIHSLTDDKHRQHIKLLRCPAETRSFQAPNVGLVTQPPRSRPIRKFLSPTWRSQRTNRARVPLAMARILTSTLRQPLFDVLTCSPRR